MSVKAKFRPVVSQPVQAVNPGVGPIVSQGVSSQTVQTPTPTTYQSQSASVPGVQTSNTSSVSTAQTAAAAQAAANSAQSASSATPSSPSVSVEVSPQITTPASQASSSPDLTPILIGGSIIALWLLLV